MTTPDQTEHKWVFAPVEPDFDPIAAKAYLFADLIEKAGENGFNPNLLWHWDKSANRLTLTALINDD